MVNLMLTGAEQQNELDKRDEKVNASPAEQDVHHPGEWATQIEAVDTHESEEEAKKHSGNFALRVNLLLSATVLAVGR